MSHDTLADFRQWPRAGKDALRSALQAACAGRRATNGSLDGPGGVQPLVRFASDERAQEEFELGAVAHELAGGGR